MAQIDRMVRVVDRTSETFRLGCFVRRAAILATVEAIAVLQARSLGGKTLQGYF